MLPKQQAQLFRGLKNYLRQETSDVQDNNLAEALKIRNLVNEFPPLEAPAVDYMQPSQVTPA